MFTRNLCFLNWSMSHNDYGATEESWNYLTHAFGFVISFIGFVYLTILSFSHQNVLYLVSAVVFGLSMMSLYGASALYHNSRSPKTRQLLQLLDHSSISILIAGTYTPVTLLVLHSTYGYILLAIIWFLAFVGIALELFLIKRIKWLSLTIYLVMGWLSLTAIRPLVQNLSTGGTTNLILGGLSYSIGVIFYVWKKLPFNHAIWHLFVLGGTAAHFFMIAGVYTKF